MTIKENEIQKLEALGLETLNLLSRARNNLQEQLEKIPPEDYDHLERTHPHRLAIDEALVPFQLLTDLMEEVDQHKIYQEQKNNQEPKKGEDVQIMSAATDVYAVFIELTEDGDCEGLESQKSEVFLEKIDAVMFCMEQIKKQIVEAFNEGYEYEFHNDGDEFFIKIEERVLTHYVIEAKTLK